MSGNVGSSYVRISVVIVLLLLLVTYLGLVVSGVLHQDQRLGTAELAVAVFVSICCFLITRPDVIARLTHIELSGLKIDLLQKVQQRQDEQQSEIENLRLILPLLLPAGERAHLRNLASDHAPEYSGSGILRQELRRLASISLIVRRGNKAISQMNDGSRFQLSDYVELTPLGRDWVTRLAEMDRPAGEAVSE